MTTLSSHSLQPSPETSSALRALSKRLEQAIKTQGGSRSARREQCCVWGSKEENAFHVHNTHYLNVIAVFRADL